MAWMESIAKKAERARQLRMQFPEFEYASPDEVLRVDNYRLNHGGFVSDFSQMAMRLAKHAAELAEQSQAGAPDFIQGAADRERAGLPPLGVKRAGVPRGVAEAFPETAVGRKVYESSSSGPSINPMGSLLDNREGLPGPLNAALDVPVLGRALTEIARPANWMSAAIAPLSFAPRAGMGVRLGAEVVAGVTTGLVGDKVTDVTGNPLLGLGAGLAAGIGAGAIASRPGTIASGVRTYRDVTARIPVGASIKDVSGGLPDDLAGGAAPSFADALDGLRNAVRTEASIRNRGIAETEIRAGRRMQFGGVRGAISQAMESGLSGEELARQARSGAATGSLRRTVAEPVQLTQAQRDALFDEVLTRVADPKQDAGLYLTTTRALQKALDGDGLQPHEIRALQPLLGHDMATALAWRAPQAGTAAPPRGAKPRGGRGGVGLPEQSQSIPTQRTDVGLPTGSRGRRSADPLIDPQAEQHRVSAIREGLKAVERDHLRTVGPSEDALMQRAHDLLTGKQGSQFVDVDSAEDVTLNLPGSPKVRKVREDLQQTINLWLQGNRELLDNMGPEGSQLIANINAQITGNVADSYLSAALARRNILAESLRATWGDVADEAAAVQRDKLISRATEALFQRELKIRYPQGVPERVTELMKTTRAMPYNESLGAVSTFTQRAKNSMFGILDVGVFGIQGVNAIRRGGVPLFASMVNRGLAAMHMPHIATTYADTMLPRQIQYGLDGVKQGAVTGAFARRQGTQEIGSLFQYLGPLGRAADRPYMAAADRLSQWQFGSVLGGIRNAAYEGDLVMAHLLGQDITKSSVRRAAAANANAIGSFAESALRKSRAQKEGVALLSAPMTRARVAQIAQMANLIKPTASPTERILAATTIISTVGYTLAVGKLLNDYIGVGDFEFMPDKPGFGQITTATGRVIDVIPQDSVERAFAKSIAAILENDPSVAAEAWGNVAIGSAGPVPRIAAGAFGVGYEEGRGYRYGDMNEDMGFTDRVLNLAPIPPLVQSAATGQLDKLGTPLEAVGITNFPESAYARAARIFEQETGGDWREAQRSEQAAFKEKHPDIAADLEQEQIDRGGEKGALAEKRKVSREEQEQDDARVQSDEIDWDTWKDNRARRLNEIRGFSEAVYGNEPIADPKNAYEEWLNVVRENKTPDGVDWDAVDGWVAEQDEARQNFIADNSGLYGTALEKERSAAGEKLEAAGYFDLGDKVWSKIGKAAKSDAKDVRAYEAELRAKIGASLSKRGLTPQQVEILTNRALENHGLLSRYKEIRNDLEQSWIVKNRELVADAYKVGYFHGSLRQIEEAAIMSASKP